jgi:hypothetical protein
MASIRVHFSHGFPLGGGFPAEQFSLRRYSIWRIFSKVYKQCCNPDHESRKMRKTIEEYMWCSAYFEYCRSKNLIVCSPGNSLLCGVPNTAGAKPDSLLPGKFPSLRSSEYRRSNSLRNFLLQRALEFCRRSLILLRYLLEQPLLSSCGLIPPCRSKLLCRKSSSKRKSRAKVHPDRRHFEIIRV